MAKETVTIYVMLIKHQNFDRILFKDKLDEYHNFVRSKVAEPERGVLLSTTYFSAN